MKLLSSLCIRRLRQYYVLASGVVCIGPSSPLQSTGDWTGICRAEPDSVLSRGLVEAQAGSNGARFLSTPLPGAAGAAELGRLGSRGVVKSHFLSSQPFFRSARSFLHRSFFLGKLAAGRGGDPHAAAGSTVGSSVTIRPGEACIEELFQNSGLEHSLQL